MPRSEADFTLQEMENLLKEWRACETVWPWISRDASDLHFAIQDLEQAIIVRLHEETGELPTEDELFGPQVSRRSR